MTNRRPYTAETAAEYLGCSPRHVRNMCKAGTLRSFRLAKLLRISADAIKELERCGLSGIEAPKPPIGGTPMASHAADPFIPLIVLPPSA